MNSGMMWFDNDPKTDLTVKIKKAADYYHRKYGMAPDTCLVNPSMFDAKVTQEGKITIRSYRPVLPGCLWIGVADKN
jgi:hypothetical protein